MRKRILDNTVDLYIAIYFSIIFTILTVREIGEHGTGKFSWPALILYVALGLLSVYRVTKGREKPGSYLRDGYYDSRFANILMPIFAVFMVIATIPFIVAPDDLGEWFGSVLSLIVAVAITGDYYVKRDARRKHLAPYYEQF